MAGIIKVKISEIKNIRAVDEAGNLYELDETHRGEYLLRCVQRAEAIPAEQKPKPAPKAKAEKTEAPKPKAAPKAKAKKAPDEKAVEG